MSAYDALLGTISQDGVELELGNGINFTGGITVTPNAATGKLDVAGGGGGGIEAPAGQIGGTNLDPTVIGIQESGADDLLTIGTVNDGAQFLKRVGSEIVSAFLGGDTLLASVPTMLANTFADVTIATAEGTGPGFVATATINDSGGFPREANLSVPMVFSDVAGQVTFRFFGTVASPVTQSVSFVRLFP